MIKAVGYISIGIIFGMWTGIAVDTARYTLIVNDYAAEETWVDSYFFTMMACNNRKRFLWNHPSDPLSGHCYAGRWVETEPGKYVLGNN